jgi:hypothetical protein
MKPYYHVPGSRSTTEIAEKVCPLERTSSRAESHPRKSSAVSRCTISPTRWDSTSTDRRLTDQVSFGVLHAAFPLTTVAEPVPNR